jgi:hypothetical protein
MDPQQAAEQEGADPQEIVRHRPIREHFYVSFFLFWSGTVGLGMWPPSGWDAYEGVIDITGISSTLGGWLRLLSGLVGLIGFFLCWRFNINWRWRLFSIVPSFTSAGILTIGFAKSGQGFAVACWSCVMMMSIGIAIYEGWRATKNTTGSTADGDA